MTAPGFSIGPASRAARSLVISNKNQCFLKDRLHGTSVAMYIVGQERRLVNPPSQVVAGVRTVTTNMDGRDALPRLSRPFAFLRAFQVLSMYPSAHSKQPASEREASTCSNFRYA